MMSLQDTATRLKDGDVAFLWRRGIHLHWHQP